MNTLKNIKSFFLRKQYKKRLSIACIYGHTRWFLKYSRLNVLHYITTIIVFFNVFNIINTFNERIFLALTIRNLLISCWIFLDKKSAAICCGFLCGFPVDFFVKNNPQVFPVIFYADKNSQVFPADFAAKQNQHIFSYEFSCEFFYQFYFVGIITFKIIF